MFLVVPSSSNKFRNMCRNYKITILSSYYFNLRFTDVWACVLYFAHHASILMSLRLNTTLHTPPNFQVNEQIQPMYTFTQKYKLLTPQIKILATCKTQHQKDWPKQVPAYQEESPTTFHAMFTILNLE